jgi:ABC-type amino acid transport substrate-binding protein
MNMKTLVAKLITLLMLAAAAVVGGAVQPTLADSAFTKIHMGADPHFRPLSFVDADGKLIGFDVDFAKVLAEHMAIPLEYEGIAWDGIIPALQAGKINAITAIVITDERKKVVAFSQPIMKQTIIGVVRADASKKGVGAADLPNMKVGVMQNTSAAATLSAMPNVQPTTYNTVIDAYNDLLLGRIDIVAVESVNGAYIVAGQYPDKLSIVEQPLSDQVKLNGVAVRQSDTQGLAQINAAIDKMKTDGSLAAIMTKWLGNTSAMPD